MELKYYLRGLGLGIIVTAIIMGVLNSKNQTMTDAQIIARAKQLGMIEDRVLSESGASKEDASKEDADEEDESEKNASNNENTGAGQSGQTDRTQKSQNTQTNTGAQGTQFQQNVPTPDDEEQAGEDHEESGQAEEEESRREEVSQRETAESANDRTLPVSDTPMVVTIGSGDGSYAASMKLADVGAISSPANFDTFLCENGYDKKIRPGTYTIPADASDEQMARIITGAE